MLNSFYFNNRKYKPLFIGILFISACSRPMDKDKSKISFLLPAVSATNSSSKDAQPLSINGKTVSTGLTGSTPINCYVIAVSGPENGMSHSSCDVSTSTGNTVKMPFGQIAGGFPAGSEASLEVPAGPGRIVSLIGLNTPTGGCVGLKQINFDASSDGYYLGKSNPIDLTAGTVSKVSIKQVFDTSVTVNNCQGPAAADLPRNGNGGGNNTLPTNLALFKQYFPVNIVLESSCQGFDIKLLDAYGNTAQASSDVTFTISTDMTNPINVYTNPSCSVAFPSNQITIPSGNSYLQAYISVTSKAGASNFTLYPSIVSQGSLALTTTSLFLNNGSSTEYAYDFGGPERILPGVCYKTILSRKQLNSTPDLNFFSTYMTNASSSLRYYSDSSCSSEISNGTIVFADNSSGTLPYAQRKYIKADPNSNSLPMITFTPAGSATYPFTYNPVIGSGSASPSYFSVRGNNQGQYGSCTANNIIFIQLKNENGTTVNSVGGNTINLDTANADFYSYPQPNPSFCSTTKISSVYIPPGEHSVPVYMRPKFISNNTINFNSTGLVATNTFSYMNQSGAAIFAGNASGTLNSVSPLASTFTMPTEVIRDSAGNIFILDSGAHCIEKVNALTGNVTTFAGVCGSPGSSDGTPGNFNSPVSMAIDAFDNIYVSDMANFTIRQVTSSGVVSTLAGYAGTSGNAAGTGSSARFGSTRKIIMGPDGVSLFVTDYTKNNIKKINSTNGQVTIFVGSTIGTSGSTDATGNSALFYSPDGLATDGSNIYVADSGNHNIRKFDPSSGSVSTLAGYAGASGNLDNPIGSLATFSSPSKLAIFSNYLYVADQSGTLIRKIVITSGAVNTVTQSNYSYSLNPNTLSGLNIIGNSLFWSGGSKVVELSPPP